MVTKRTPQSNLCIRVFLIIALVVLTGLPGAGWSYSSETGHKHETHAGDTVKAHDHAAHEASMKTEEAAELVQSVGVDEKTGGKVPLDTEFTDETGNRISLSEIVDRPTIILPIFYYCPVVCPMLLSSLASALNDVPFDAGKDYRVVALSFNDEETPDVAKDSKEDYMRLLPGSFPESSWAFLTGRHHEILKVTEAIGYRFRKTGKNTFVHPNALVVIAEDGTVIRYLYGSVFLGADIGMAISEAQSKTPGVSIKRILSYCFNYNPEGRQYIVTILKVTASATVIVLVLFFIFFLRKTDRESEHDIGQAADTSVNHSEKGTGPDERTIS